MKIEISSTEILTTIDGMRLRLWEGVTNHGVKCKVFVHKIAVHKDDDASEFKMELDAGDMPFQLEELLTSHRRPVALP